MNVAQLSRFTARSLGRDLRLGELRVLALALIVAVASVTAVGFFTDRIGRAVERQASDVLAADLIATTGTPLPDSLLEEVADRDLLTARHTRFPSVVVNAADESQLVAVKAVTDGYPLRGVLRLAPLDAPSAEVQQPDVPAAEVQQPDALSVELRQPDAPSTEVQQLDATGRGLAPEPGTVWIDPQLQSALALSPGDSLTLGAMEFAVTRLILFEPDRGENIFEFAPRVMINEVDLDAAELLGVGSRARYTLLRGGGPAGQR